MGLFSFLFGRRKKERERQENLKKSRDIQLEKIQRSIFNNKIIISRIKNKLVVIDQDRERYEEAIYKKYGVEKGNRALHQDFVLGDSKTFVKSIIGEPEEIQYKNYQGYSKEIHKYGKYGGGDINTWYKLYITYTNDEISLYNKRDDFMVENDYQKIENSIEKLKNEEEKRDLRIKYLEKKYENFIKNNQKESIFIDPYDGYYWRDYIKNNE